nr:hypothetical protein [Pseudomonas putida]
MHSLREKTQEEVELIERARRMVPQLKERAAQAERDLRIPDQTIAELAVGRPAARPATARLWRL